MRADVTRLVGTLPTDGGADLEDALRSVQAQRGCQPG